MSQLFCSDGKKQKNMVFSSNFKCPILLHWISRLIRDSCLAWQPPSSFHSRSSHTCHTMSSLWLSSEFTWGFYQPKFLRGLQNIITSCRLEHSFEMGICYSQLFNLTLKLHITALSTPWALAQVTLSGTWKWPVQTMLWV